jgi:hypothetical protein
MGDKVSAGLALISDSKISLYPYFAQISTVAIVIVLFISIYVDVNHCLVHLGPLNDAPAVRRVYPDGRIHSTRDSSSLTLYVPPSAISVLLLFRLLMYTKLSSNFDGPPLSRMIAFQFCQKVWIAIPLAFRA